MISCSVCGYDSPSKMNFCGKCGSSLSQEAVVADDHDLSENVLWGGIEAERRHLTVLFCDLVGSTNLVEKLDPEDMRVFVRSYQQYAKQVISEYGGRVTRIVGDGIVSHFTGSEANAEHAVHAGLQLVSGIDSVYKPVVQGRAVSVQARVGISTGLAVTRDIIGFGAHTQDDAIGVPLHIAARIQAIAKPNEVVICDNVYRLVKGLFKCTSLGKRNLKGFSQTKRIWQVLEAEDIDTRFDSIHAARLTPLVGREDMMQVLMDSWRSAVRGKGSVVYLTGEAGIGKSRLVRELYRRTKHEPQIRLRYQCSRFHKDNSFYTILTRMRNDAQLRPQDSPSTQLDKLESMLSPTTDNMQSIASMFAALLSIPNDGRYAELNIADPAYEERILDVISQQILALTRIQPLLVQVEDVHWSDPSSLEVLERTVKRARRLRIMIIITSRPVFTPDFVVAENVTCLKVERLPLEQTRKMVGALIQNNTLYKQVVDRVAESTDGIPLFVEELCRAFTDVYERSDREPADLENIKVPATIYDSLAARVDHLSPQARIVVQCGAAIGREFSYDLLPAVTGLEESELRLAISQILKSDLVYLREMFPTEVYIFKHAMVREVAYQSLLSTQRARLHAIIAGEIESRHPDIARISPELLAYHWHEAMEINKSIYYWLQAARAASKRLTSKDVINYVNQGKALLAQLTESSVRSQMEKEFRNVIKMIN